MKNGRPGFRAPISALAAVSVLILVLVAALVGLVILVLVVVLIGLILVIHVSLPPNLSLRNLPLT